MAGHPHNPKTLESFLKKYRYNKDDENCGEITHTRIWGQEENLWWIVQYSKRSVKSIS